MRGFLFECKKVVKKKTTLIAISLSILAAIGLYMFNHSVAEDIEQGNISRLESFPEIFLNFANEMKEEKKMHLRQEILLRLKNLIGTSTIIKRQSSTMKN